MNDDGLQATSESVMVCVFPVPARVFPFVFTVQFDVIETPSSDGPYEYEPLLNVNE